MKDNADGEVKRRCRELGTAYFKKFKKGIPVPFGIGLLGTWTDEDYIREYEIALETGVPLEPGTDRWREVFGDPVDIPPDVAI